MNLETTPIGEQYKSNENIQRFAISPWRREILQRGQGNGNADTREIPQLTHNPIFHTTFEGAVAELYTYIDTQYLAIQDVEKRFNERGTVFISTPTKEQLNKLTEHVCGLSADTNIVVLYPGDTYTKWSEWNGNTQKVFTVE